MDREIYEFSETCEVDAKSIPQRIDDLRALVASIKGIIKGIYDNTGRHSGTTTQTERATESFESHQRPKQQEHEHDDLRIRFSPHNP